MISEEDYARFLRTTHKVVGFCGGQRYSSKAFRIEPGLDKVWVSSGSTDFGLGKSPGDPYIYDGVSAYNGSFWENYVNFNVDVLNPTFDIIMKVNTPKEMRFGLEVSMGRPVFYIRQMNILILITQPYFLKKTIPVFRLLVTSILIDQAVCG